MRVDPSRARENYVLELRILQLIGLADYTMRNVAKRAASVTSMILSLLSSNFYGKLSSKPVIST